MKIIFASDHAGFDLKEELKVHVASLGHEIEDLGAHELDPSDDYPTFILPAARAVADSGDLVRGIILGGSGQGEAIAANRVVGIRAAVYYGGPNDIITLSREHNDANVLSLGARFISVEEAKEVVTLWLATPFGGDERHVRRIAALDS